jgi:hypothetical protein
MELPKFILGDNTKFPTAIYVIHTEFPRFIINLETDEVEWLEDFDTQDEEELLSETETAIKEATAFYDSEFSTYDN